MASTSEKGIFHITVIDNEAGVSKAEKILKSGSGFKGAEIADVKITDWSQGKKRLTAFMKIKGK